MGNSAPIQIVIIGRRLSISLLVIAICLVAIHCILNYYTHEFEEVPWLIHQLFDLDEENNLPTWFSSFLLLSNAMRSGAQYCFAMRCNTMARCARVPCDTLRSGAKRCVLVQYIAGKRNAV